MGFGGKRDDVIVPAAVIAAASIGDEDYFGLAVAVEVLRRVILVENYAKPGCAEHHVPAAIVDRRSAPVAIHSAIARRAKRNLVAVPKSFRVGPVQSFRETSAMAGNLTCQVVLSVERGHGRQNDHCC